MACSLAIPTQGAAFLLFPTNCSALRSWAAFSLSTAVIPLHALQRCRQRSHFSDNSLLWKRAFLISLAPSCLVCFQIDANLYTV